jgi:hypothetical protein
MTAIDTFRTCHAHCTMSASWVERTSFRKTPMSESDRADISWGVPQCCLSRYYALSDGGLA